ncbi:hypothetical protein StoSoilA2_06450 [Arthrobacter sp. StoSoilA2]|nr:hypothetical protein StoSoilA2_06450 [Arthrobacter sp. StoSoilA2]BCW52335.1 hypothetical protein StoSoilB13_46770 [Arthrobacter sp. StoSoilB13]
MGELCQGSLKAALADVAPGTRDVGPDLNLHAVVNFEGLARIPEKSVIFVTHCRGWRAQPNV